MAIKDSTFPLQDALLLLSNQPQQQQRQDDDVFNDDSNTPVHVTDEDLQWSDDELTTLLKNETAQLKQRDSEAVKTVKWMMKVVNFLNLNPTTAILAVDYFDRFINSISNHQHNVEKHWTLQLTAVACLSLAAKVEETDPPLLLDIQVEEAKFMFEAKTIQRMELLVLSTLQWRMHPVTPFSYIDHFIRRLGLKLYLQLQFFHHSSRILTSLVTDERWSLYPSSALAYATMLHVMEMELSCYYSSSSIDDDDDDDDETQLFSELITINNNKEKVSECYKLIQDMNFNIYKNKKRRFGIELDQPSSSSSSYDVLASDISNESWDLSQSQTQQQPYSTTSSSSELPALKRTRYYTNDEDGVKDHNFEILE